jgi:hypothetical protein
MAKSMKSQKVKSGFDLQGFANLPPCLCASVVKSVFEALSCTQTLFKQK